MTIFVELRTFPQTSQFKKFGGNLTKDGVRSAGAGKSSARRPTRGLEIKDDTYATLRVVRSDGSPVPLTDSGSPDGANTDGYTNFILQSVQEARQEKTQIIETFGASYVFFFGEQPRMLQISAVLVNSLDFNWEAEWWANYNTYLRGTKLVEMGARCYLAYDDNVVEGYLMNATANKSSDQPHLVQLQFTFFVTQCHNVSSLGTEDYPIRSSAQIPDNVSLKSWYSGGDLMSNLQGGPLMNALGRNLPQATRFSNTLIEDVKPGAGRSISELVRNMPPSFAVSPEYYPILESRADIRALVNRSGNPIRSKIRDNRDEYVGFYLDLLALQPNYIGQATVRSTQDTLDLFRQATQQLLCYGADIDNPEAHKLLGIGPTFSSSNQAGATFGATSKATFGMVGSAGVGLQAVAGGSFSASADVFGQSQSSFSASAFAGQARYDSLSAVYGKVSASTTKFSSTLQKVEEKGFDFTYGYESDYTPGPGFGKAGFGDFGGNGFGSANGAGDPGYVRPDAFTFSGVSEHRSAFSRFTRTRTDRTAITQGPVVGRGELTGGASAFVGGKISAFAIVGLPGDLDITGNFRQSAEFQSKFRSSLLSGFSTPTPGVACPAPSPASTGTSTFNFSSVSGATLTPGSDVSNGTVYSSTSSSGSGLFEGWNYSDSYSKTF